MCCKPVALEEKKEESLKDALMLLQLPSFLKNVEDERESLIMCEVNWGDY